VPSPRQPLTAPSRRPYTRAMPWARGARRGRWAHAEGDGDGALRARVRHFLREAGYRSAVATGADEALAVLSRPFALEDVLVMVRRRLGCRPLAAEALLYGTRPCWRCSSPPGRRANGSSGDR
jgi:hypothetical protein